MADIIDVNAIFGGMPSSACDAGLDSLLQALDEYEITACCALSTIGVLLDHATGNGASKAAAVRSSRLVPVATVNPTRCLSDVAWVAGLASEGYRMLRFFQVHQRWDPDDASFGAVLGALARSPLPIMLEAGDSGCASRMVRAVGDYPGNIVLAGVRAETLAEAIALMRADRRVYVETSDLLAYGAIKAAVAAVGVDRVLFGSGAPVRPVRSALAVARQSGLSDDDLARVLSGNARRSLSL
jgi:predicted TIM-barrel fold metal-dependent hydrolase